ncbi:MAG: beta-ketoacyl-ACP synthase II [Candidatus Desantisbacteria bacterium]
MSRRVVVTGIGVIAPNGMGKERFLEAIVNGRSGIKKITRFDTTAYPSRIAGEVDDFEPTDYMDKKDARRRSRCTQLAMAAARMAMNDSGINLTHVEHERMGIVLGFGTNGMEIIESQHQIFLSHGLKKVSPFGMISVLLNTPTGEIAIEFGISGPSNTLSTGCSSAVNAVGNAFNLIRWGAADIVVTGGAEAPITPLTLTGFCAARSLSCQNEHPEEASRPFDVRRDGLIMGEGAGIIILEEMNHALIRKADIYAELLGYSSTTNATSLMMPDASGTSRALKSAMKDAEVTPESIDYYSAHAVSTTADVVEINAIKQTFGEYAYHMPVSSIKSMIGQPFCAAGAIQTTSCVLAVKHDVIPPTINHCEPGPGCEGIDFVPNVARKQVINKAILNSYGYGGNNACLVMGSFCGSQTMS